MKRLILIVLAIATCCSGCIKEKTTILEAWAYNHSSHQISILFYSNGVLPEGNTISLQPNDSIRLGSASELGDVTAPGFYSDYARLASDPVYVIFDDSIQVVHYNEILDSTVKYYPFSSNRNIRNPLSYEFTRVKSNKGYYTNMHRYYFTEADYEFAKD